MGNSLKEFIPYGVYEAADGHLAVVVIADHHWKRLCAVIDRKDLADDERFAAADAQVEHREEVDDLFASAVAERGAHEWFERLRDHQVPSAPILDTLEVWEDEHVEHRDLTMTVRDGDHEVRAIRYPVEFDDVDGEVERGVPDLGDYTRAALREAGVREEWIESILERIRPHSPE